MALKGRAAKFTLAAAILCTLVPVAQGGPVAQSGDVAPLGLACRFEAGNTWSYDAGKFKSVPPSPLTFEIAEINLEKQSAQLITDDKATGSLRIVRALNANHFLEVANEGFLNLTTIYDKDPATGTLPAVHSRHFGILGQPVFAQYAGFCTPK
ncbi:MAG: hypothetical protein ABL907_09005 [Hyphomicrobium sp.]